MNLLSIFATSLLVGLVTTKSIQSPGNSKLKNIATNPYPDEFSIYTAEHDICNLVVLNNDIDDSDDDDSNENITEDSDEDSDDAADVLNILKLLREHISNKDNDAKLFFVQADIDESGKKDYKGLYMLQNKTIITKLLENGRDTTVATDGSESIYFAATDGLYKYNDEKNMAEKYGTLTDNFIDIDIDNNSDALYVINNKFEMFKVTDEGTTKEKLEDVENAQQLILDSSNNIYYYGEDKITYVINSDGKKKISGLPDDFSYIQLFNPPNYSKNSAYLILDKQIYSIRADGKSKMYTDLDLNRPNGYVRSHNSRYFAYGKKIYNEFQLELAKLEEKVKLIAKDFKRLEKLLDFELL